MAMVFSFRDLLAERCENAQQARDNAWREFQQTVRVLRKAQDAMDDAHRKFMQADRDLENARGR
jgi:hypothetical protein